MAFCLQLSSSSPVPQMLSQIAAEGNESQTERLQVWVPVLTLPLACYAMLGKLLPSLDLFSHLQIEGVRFNYLIILWAVIPRYFPDRNLPWPPLGSRESKTKEGKPSQSWPWVGIQASAHRLVLCPQSANFLVWHIAPLKVLQYPLPWLL